MTRPRENFDLPEGRDPLDGVRSGEPAIAARLREIVFAFVGRDQPPQTGRAVSIVARATPAGKARMGQNPRVWLGFQILDQFHRDFIEGAHAPVNSTRESVEKWA